jgi:hypothetical protein
MHALIHPRAKKCTNAKGNMADRSEVFKNLGYVVSVVRPQIQPGIIGGNNSLKNYFVKHIGQDTNNLLDFIGLKAYELDVYDAVILVDYDTLILG